MINVKIKAWLVSRVDERGSSCYDYGEIIYFIYLALPNLDLFAIIFLLSARMI